MPLQWAAIKKQPMMARAGKWQDTSDENARLVHPLPVAAAIVFDAHFSTRHSQESPASIPVHRALLRQSRVLRKPGPTSRSAPLDKMGSLTSGWDISRPHKPPKGGPSARSQACTAPIPHPELLRTAQGFLSRAGGDSTAMEVTGRPAATLRDAQLPSSPTPQRLTCCRRVRGFQRALHSPQRLHAKA